MKLERTPYYNPFILEGRSVKEIVFFNANGEIVRNSRGWFGSGNNELRDGLEIPEVKKRLKEDFSRKESFYMTFKGEYSHEGTLARLYLYVDGETIKQRPTTYRTDCYNGYEIYHYAEYHFDILGVPVSFEFVDWIEKTALAEELDELKKEIEKERLKVDDYTLRSLFQKFKIEKRRP